MFNIMYALHIIRNFGKVKQFFGKTFGPVCFNTTFVNGMGKELGLSAGPEHQYPCLMKLITIK